MTPFIPFGPGASSPDELSRQRARHQGREAFYAGRQLGDCPATLSAPLRAEWVAAWEEAREIRERLDDKLMREG